MSFKIINTLYHTIKILDYVINQILFYSNRKTVEDTYNIFLGYNNQDKKIYIIEATRLYRIVNIYFHKKKVVFCQ